MAIGGRILLGRMVRDNQKCSAVTQSQSHCPEEAKKGESSESVCPESQEPEEKSFHLLLQKKINSEEEDETWSEVSTDCLPTDCLRRLIFNW